MIRHASLFSQRISLFNETSSTTWFLNIDPIGMPKAITPGAAVQNNSHSSFVDRYVVDFTRCCLHAEIQVV
ncbi:MAG: hypothetical protein R6T98_16840 [Desulfatiglandales bacterium]